MKKIMMIMGVIMVAGSVNAAELMKLPAPNTKGGKALMQAMDERKSYRDFSDKEIDNQTLSEILWSAYGKNSRGTRTIPTARNQLNLKVYAVLKNGTWLYDADNNTLTLITDKDILPLLAKQDYAADAPLNLIFTGSDKNYSAMHAGSAYQNVGLYTASKGMINVVRGMIDHEGIKKALNLSADENVIVSQTIGWSK